MRIYSGSDNDLRVENVLDIILILFHVFSNALLLSFAKFALNSTPSFKLAH